jgi:hypothetical protein
MNGADKMYKLSQIGPAARWIAIMLLGLIVSCTRADAPQSGTVKASGAAPASDAACTCPDQQAQLDLTRQLLADDSSRYQAARERAKAWLDRLRVDPFELREHGLKGKKKLAEQLDAYTWLTRGATPLEKRQLMARIRAVAAVTYEPRFHDMLSISDVQFKQDSTSYLRIAYLMDGLGLDTKLYRQEIAKILPRLDAQMPQRGSHQVMAFDWYYQHFGLAEPFPLAIGFEHGIIHAQPDPYKLGEQEAYTLTHEIFVPYHFGDDLDADFFNPAQKQYLRRALDRLTVHYIMRNDPDIVSELLSCMRYLHFTDLPVYREGLSYILDNQNPDGSWGRYENLRPRLGDYVDQELYLHTTSVAIGALTVAYH